MKQKSENQKAFPRFLGILVVASLIGGVLGGLSGVAGYFWEDHTAFGAAFAHLLGAASPWAMLPVPPCCWVLDCTSTASPTLPSMAGTARMRM